jgi:hypothetical protein
MSRLRLDPSLPARLARLAAFASRCGPVAHEAMSAHCEVAADFAAGDEPVPLTDVLSCAPGTPVDELPGDRRLAVCEALADFADLKSARRGSHSPTGARVLAAADVWG